MSDDKRNLTVIEQWLCHDFPSGPERLVTIKALWSDNGTVSYRVSAAFSGNVRGCVFDTAEGATIAEAIVGLADALNRNRFSPSGWSDVP